MKKIKLLLTIFISILISLTNISCTQVILGGAASGGIILVQEAGGKVTQPNGNQWQIDNSDILASNGFIHNQLVENINN